MKSPNQIKLDQAISQLLECRAKGYCPASVQIAAYEVAHAARQVHLDAMQQGMEAQAGAMEKLLTSIIK